MCNTLLQKLNHWWDRRRTARALDRLDDHLLYDIGLCRIGGQYFPTGAVEIPAALNRAGPAVSRGMLSRDDLLRSPEALGWNAVRDAIAPDGKATATTDGRKKAMQRRRGASATVVRKAA